MWTLWAIACSSESDIVSRPPPPVVPTDPTIPSTTTLIPGPTGTTTAGSTTAQGGEPPSCVIDAPQDGLLARPPLDLLGSVSDADTPPAQLNASWTSTLAGPLFTGPVALDGRVDLLGAVATSGVHVLVLSAVDAHGNACSDTHTVEVNAPPGPPIPSIAPGAPLTADTLTWQLDAPAVDPEGDLLTTTVQWQVDGLAAGTTDVLDAAATERGQVVTVGVTAWDALGPGATGWSAPVVIGNTPPTAPVVEVVPGAPYAGDALLCVVNSASHDDDDDAVTYSMSWTVDSAPWAATTSSAWPGDGIPSGQTASGELWTCSATPFDAIDVGPSGTSSVTVQAHIPPSDCPDGNCALRFDGIDDWVEVVHDPALNISGRAWTVEAWAWFDTLGNCQTLLRKGIATSPTYEYWLHKNFLPDDSAHWLSWTGWSVIGWGAFEPLRWHHFAGTWDPATGAAEAFIDGVSYGTALSFGAPTANTDPVRIGIDWDFGCEMNGVIDELRISDVVRYSGAFVPDVVHALDAQTVALWHFDEFSGATAFDATGSGHDGAILGATWTDENPP